MKGVILLKIAFWSNAKGSSGVTSNLACISVASVMQYSCKVVLWENHKQKNSLGNTLLSNRSQYYMNEEENYQLKSVGMNHIVNHFVYRDNECPLVKLDSGCLNYGSNIKDHSLEIINESLFYIPNSSAINHELYDYDLYQNINNIMNTLDSFAEITFIDTSNCNNLSSKIILEEADLVVVNLVQDSSVIQHFFDNYSSIVHKCVFLIGRYHKQSNLNKQKISKLHSIQKSQIAVIPYNYEYQEAVDEGTVIEFLSRNLSGKRKNPNYDFIIQVKKAVQMIMEHINYMNNPEACL